MMLRLKQGQKGKGQSPVKQAISKVLLVCVYDTIVFEITNEIIRSKFQKFGFISKLLIFQKGEVTKFFIEYDREEAAIQAKSSLNGTKLCDSICKMSIHFSNLANVDIKHPTSQNQSYNSFEQISTKSLLSGHQSQSSLKEISSNWNWEDDDPLLRAFSPFNSVSRSKTDIPKSLEEHINHMKSEQLSQQIDNSIKQSIDNIIGTSTSSSFLGSPPKMKEDNLSHSSILSFSIQKHIPLHCVYNIFSNFGNISCIVCKKNTVYVKFRTKQFAAIAYNYLNQSIFLNNHLILERCLETSEDWKPVDGQYCHCFYYDASFDRFTAQRSITINPPSQTLHVSSMKKQICNENYLRRQFEAYGRVDKVHILKQSKEKNMALIKFHCIEDSFAAMSYLHNEVFMDRKMQISFTKSKI